MVIRVADTNILVISNTMVTMLTLDELIKFAMWQDNSSVLLMMVSLLGLVTQGNKPNSLFIDIGICIK